MRQNINKKSSLFLSVYWGGQGLIFSLTPSKFLVIIGGILVLMSVLKSLISSYQYNILFLIYCVFCFLVSSIYVFLFSIMFSIYICLLLVLLNLLVIIVMIKRYGAN